MSQSRNSGRNATLDQRKQRAAGRQQNKSPEREAIADWQRPVSMKGKTGGAAGRGRGAGASSAAKASHQTVGRATKSAKRRAG